MKNALSLKAFSENGSKRKKVADEGVPHVRFKKKLAGARSKRRTPGTIDDDLENGKGMVALMGLFCIGGRWKGASESTTATATSSLADGGVG